MSRGNRGGRPPKPTALLKLAGTARPDRHGDRINNEPVPVGDLIAPPAWFTGGLLDEWRHAIEHAPAGLLKEIDRNALVLWCVASDNLRVATIELQKMNTRRSVRPLMKGGKGAGMIPSSYIGVIEKSSAAMFRAMTELGFSPAARPRLKVDRPDGGDVAAVNPWSQFKPREDGASVN